MKAFQGARDSYTDIRPIPGYFVTKIAHLAG
jgi:hypothetical protein